MANQPTLCQSLVAGGAAGTCTDLLFFPIDTIKTRVQAKEGFWRSGGWKGIYHGVGSVIVASAPGAALFFVCYDQGKQLLPRFIPEHTAAVHMLSASIGEIVACSVRVPSEVIKQRVQASHYKTSWQALRAILNNVSGEGRFRGLFRGYGTTIFREIPFTAIQFPLYEGLKRRWAAASHKSNLSPWQGAVCGSLAGGVAAAATTPLDVLKTRLMLTKQRVPLTSMIKDISHEGLGAFFRGIVPRTLWISAGGAVFLGVYELALSMQLRSRPNLHLL